MERGYVLDASALLAMLHEEPGGEQIPDLLAHAVMSTVNWAEVVQKALARQVEVNGLRQELEATGLGILPFTAEQAETTARLRAETVHAGLSLGDRACLALAAELDLPAMTVDRAWERIQTSVEVRILRR